MYPEIKKPRFSLGRDNNIAMHISCETMGWDLFVPHTHNLPQLIVEGSYPERELLLNFNHRETLFSLSSNSFSST